MSDKEKYSGAVWFVRGVPAELRAQVAAAAEEAGMKVGAWVERALRAALEHPGGAGHGQGDTRDLAAVVAELVERVGRLEASQVPAAIPGRLASSPDAAEPATGVEASATAEASPGSSGAVDEADVTGGDGTRRRLTSSGVTKVESMIRAGLSDVDIARLFGLDRGAIRQRRKKLEALLGPDFGLVPIERVRRVHAAQRAGKSPVEVLAILSDSGGEPEKPDD